MKRIAVFPGSFDPITLGHRSIVLRALPMFDIIYVAVGVNMEKRSTFPLENRIKWAKAVFADYPCGELRRSHRRLLQKGGCTVHHPWPPQRQRLRV